MSGQSYDHMMGNPLDADEHPDTILPDTGAPNRPESPGEYIKARKSLNALSDQMNFYNALGNLYKQGN